MKAGSRPRGADRLKQRGNRMPPANAFHMPAEWEPHARTFLSWPVQKAMIDPARHDAVADAYAAVARAAAVFEPVCVLANPGGEAAVRARCGADVSVLIVPHDDAWLRDNGPTFVRGADGALAGVSWRFNAWGEKYRPFAQDDALAARLLGLLGVPCLPQDIVLEGGSVHTDGEGTLLTTAQCLLHPNRNPRLKKEQIAQTLCGALGVSRVIWLPFGLDGDETDGHVDNVACFAAPGVVLLQVCRDESDPNFARTQANRAALAAARDARGRALRVVEIEQPPLRAENGARLALSYLNFYLVNGGLLLPVFGGAAQRTDRAAAQTLQAAFPGRRVVPLDGLPLIREGGNIHCITQQMPAGICPDKEEAACDR